MDITDNRVAAMARAWIDTLNAKNQWRVETLVRRTRWSDETHTESPVKLKRFAEGCPPSQMKAAMDYLLSLAPYTGVVVNGERTDTEYRPTRTSWIRDDGHVVNRQARLDGTYTLVQDLKAVGASDDLDAVTSVSCSEEVVSEWHWDEDDIEDVPPSEQGVVWSVQATTRHEDGSFDYALVKRQSLTQHTGPVTAKDSAEETVTVETWSGLYGNPDAGFFDHSGNPVSVPSAGASGGTLVDVSVSQSDDCTYRVQATRTTSKKTTSRTTSAHNQFEGSHGETSTGNQSPLPVAPDASGGVVTSHSSTLRPDGTYANEVEVSVERPVSEAVVEVSVGRRGRANVVENRNQRQPASTSSVGVGGSVRVEKTPGGLFNNRITSWVTAVKTKVSELCSIDLFKHHHKKTTTGESMSASDSHVEGSGTGGLVKTVTTEMDDQGSVSKTVDETRERKVVASRETWSVGLTGVRHSVTTTQTPTKGEAPAFSRATVGSTVTNEKTPGGLFNVETTTYDRDSSPVSTSSSCAKTVFEHRDVTVTSDPSGDLGSCVDDAKDGVHRQTSVRLSDDGSSVETVETTTELASEGSSVRIRRTPKAVVTTSTDRNVPDPAADPGSVGEESHERTPGGLYNHTTVSVTATNGSDTAGCERTVFETRRTRQETSKASSPDASDVDAASGGVYVRRTSRVDELGIRTNDIVTTTETKVESSSVQIRRTAKAIIKTTTDRNTTSTASTPSSIGTSNHDTTPGGLHNLTTTTVSAIPGAKDYASCEATVFNHSHVKQEVSSGSGPDESDVQSAGGGVVYKKTSTVDENGIVTTNTTESRELNQPLYQKRYTATHFTKTKHTADRHNPSSDCKEIPYLVRDGNTVTTVTESLNPGGTYDRTVETVEASFQYWEDPVVSLSHKYRRRLSFRNATKAQMDDLYDKFMNGEGSDKGFIQLLTEWEASDRFPQHHDVSPSTSLNEFGLLDGTFTADASWSSDSAGLTGDLSYTFVDRTHTLVTMSEDATPITEGADAGKIRLTQVASRRKIRTIHGRGRANYDNLVQGEYLEGTSFSFSPSTGVYMAHVVLSVTSDVVKSTVVDAEGS